MSYRSDRTPELPAEETGEWPHEQAPPPPETGGGQTPEQKSPVDARPRGPEQYEQAPPPPEPTEDHRPAPAPESRARQAEQATASSGSRWEAQHEHAPPPPPDHPGRIHPIESAGDHPGLTPAAFNTFEGGVDPVVNDGEPMYRVVGVNAAERAQCTDAVDRRIADGNLSGGDRAAAIDAEINAAYEGKAINGEYFTPTRAQSAEDALQRSAVASEWGGPGVEYRQYEVRQAEGPITTYEGRAKPQGHQYVDEAGGRREYEAEINPRLQGRPDHYKVHAQLEGYGTQIFVPRHGESRNVDAWTAEEVGWDRDEDP